MYLSNFVIVILGFNKQNRDPGNFTYKDCSKCAIWLGVVNISRVENAEVKLGASVIHRNFAFVFC